MKGKLLQLKADAKAAGWAHYIRTPNDERAVLKGCYIDPSRGKRVCDFFEKFLCHSKGRWAGQSLILAPYHREQVIMPAFSWLQADGKRRFNKLHWWVAKKNAKSTVAAGLTLYFLIADGEPGPEVYTLANDREQAGIVFGVARDMVAQSPALRKMLKVTPFTKTITIRGQTNAWIRALSAEVQKHEGLIAQAWVIDEIHSFVENGRRLYDTMRFAGTIREQPMEIVISTAGDNDMGIGYEVYSTDTTILSGELANTSTFVSIAEAPKDDPIDDPATWGKANPMLGVSISEKEMEEEASEALQSPRKGVRFRRYRLNQWVFGGSDPWLPMDAWDECDEPIDLEALHGRLCGAGIDVATTTDMCAYALCFPPEEDEKHWKFLVKFFLPERMTDGGDIYQRAIRDQNPDYPEWVEQGHLTLTPTMSTDYDFIEEALRGDSELYDIREYGFDPYQFRDRAKGMGNRHGWEMVEMPQQGFAISEAAQYFETLIIERILAHGSNPALRRQASQVTVKPNAQGHIHMVKSDGKRHFRIDGIVACVMALRRAQQMIKKSVYEDREPLLI